MRNNPNNTTMSDQIDSFHEAPNVLENMWLRFRKNKEPPPYPLDPPFNSYVGEAPAYGFRPEYFPQAPPPIGFRPEFNPAFDVPQEYCHQTYGYKEECKLCVTVFESITL